MPVVPPFVSLHDSVHVQDLDGRCGADITVRGDSSRDLSS